VEVKVEHRVLGEGADSEYDECAVKPLVQTYSKKRAKVPDFNEIVSILSKC
jgi:hypothetical protein